MTASHWRQKQTKCFPAPLTSCALWALLATAWRDPEERRVPGWLPLIGGRKKQIFSDLLNI